MPYKHPAPFDATSEPVRACVVWGRWEGEADEPIAERFSVAEARKIASDSLEGVYPWEPNGTGAPTIRAWVVTRDGQTVYSTPND